ncbi:SCP2 sterol-binding domain-containing protein [Acrocarpospora sp. B8E8]|uniref:SCP2 sterol-binding domain-containing protein n=1 Tax=Acrocarpospora sp. B8E8 TaxID=3153572 RepID=UPI00325D74D3
MPAAITHRELRGCLQIMGGFRSADEVHQFLGGTFEEALADDSIGPKLAGTGMSLRMDYTDPDTTVRVDFPTRQILVGAAAAIESDATLSMTADTANQYWQGKVSLPLAMARGKVKIGGLASQLLKLTPVAKDLYPRYVKMLADNGRSDLIAK